MPIENIDTGSEIISTTHNNNNNYIINEINNLKGLIGDVADLQANKADKSEILRQIDLVASNILNDTSGVDGYGVDNALLGLRNSINNIQNAGANANIGLYNMVDETNTNNYIADKYELDKFEGLTISLYVANSNTGSSTLDIQDGTGSVEIKVEKADGTKRDLFTDELYSWNILHFDGTHWVLLDKTTYVNESIGDLGLLETTSVDNLVSSINEVNSIATINDTEIENIELKTDFITVSEAVNLNTIQSNLSTAETDIDNLEINKADKSSVYTRTEVDNKDSELAGVGRTTETIKGNADNLQTHENDTTNPHSVTATQVGAYSKTEMQTSGQSQLHWDNLTDTPNFADSSWKSAVSTYGELPTTGNALNDMRVVADDSGSPENVDTGGTAIYTCIATTGTISDQWDKLADLDWTNDHGALVGLSDDDHVQYLRHDGTRAMTGDLDVGGNELKNAVLQNAVTLPSDIEGLIYYDPNTKEVKVRMATTTDVISGAGAIIREVEITATAGQTVFDVSQGGIYSYSTSAGVIDVYKKNANGLYELVDTDDYVETDNQTITLNTGANAGDEYFFKWLKNIATIASAIEANSVTNNKLATDVKVGSLASLNTTDKSNVVGAINETLSSIRTNEEIQDIVDGVIIGGTNISKVYDDINNTLTLNLSITDTDILNRIKNVDGAGSGLNADLLDGKQGSEYQPAGTYNTIIGTDTNINIAGATVIDGLTLTDGVITAHSTRDLVASDIGASATGHVHDYLPSSGGQLTGGLGIVENNWNSSSLTGNAIYTDPTGANGFAFGNGTSVSTWFSYDGTTIRRAIDVYNNGFSVKITPPLDVVGRISTAEHVNADNGYQTGNFEMVHNATTDSLDFNYTG